MRWKDASMMPIACGTSWLVSIVWIYGRLCGIISAIDHGRYKAENITTLSDGGGGEPLPTKENIIAAMRELVDGAKEDDILFFHCTCVNVPPSTPHHVELSNHFGVSALPTFEYWRSHFLVDSGHGIQVADQNGDEDDGFDEGTQQNQLLDPERWS